MPLRRVPPASSSQPTERLDFLLYTACCGQRIESTDDPRTPVARPLGLSKLHIRRDNYDRWY